MYKGRSQSAQRGSYYRDGSGWTHRDLKRFAELPLAAEEIGNFHCGAITPEKLADRLRPTVRDLARNGFRKPADVAKLLNRSDVRTANGGKWTPRLAWFLLSLIYGGCLPRAPKVTIPRLNAKALADPPTIRGAQFPVRKV